MGGCRCKAGCSARCGCRRGGVSCTDECQCVLSLCQNKPTPPPKAAKAPETKKRAAGPIASEPPAQKRSRTQAQVRTIPVEEKQGGRKRGKRGNFNGQTSLIPEPASPSPSSTSSSSTFSSPPPPPTHINTSTNIPSPISPSLSSRVRPLTPPSRRSRHTAPIITSIPVSFSSSSVNVFRITQTTLFEVEFSLPIFFGSEWLFTGSSQRSCPPLGCG